MTQVIVPAGLDLPEGYDEERWQEARIAARPPGILIDRKLLSEQSRAALEKQRGITLIEAIELYFELLIWGYRKGFKSHQKRKATPENLKNAPVEDRLTQDLRGKRNLALDFWPAALGDEPVDEISVDDVNDALERFWLVPANHGKSKKDRGKFNLIELIEKADAKRAQFDKDIEAAEARGAGSEEIDRMRLEGHQARISVTTYIKHGRVMRAVGEMLMDMQLIDQNPFSICTWGNKEEKALKSPKANASGKPGTIGSTTCSARRSIRSPWKTWGTRCSGRRSSRGIKAWAWRRSSSSAPTTSDLTREFRISASDTTSSTE